MFTKPRTEKLLGTKNTEGGFWKGHISELETRKGLLSAPMVEDEYQESIGERSLTGM